MLLLKIWYKDIKILLYTVSRNVVDVEGADYFLR